MDRGAGVTILVSVIVILRKPSTTRYKTRTARAMSTSLGGARDRIRESSLRLLLSRIRDHRSIVDEDQRMVQSRIGTPTRNGGDTAVYAVAGKAEINRIKRGRSEPNLVRTTEERRNLEHLVPYRIALQAEGVKSGRPIPLPDLEAHQITHQYQARTSEVARSAVNAGSLVWEENPGDWRIRLKGQPARTDVSLTRPTPGSRNWKGACAVRRNCV